MGTSKLLSVLWQAITQISDDLFWDEALKMNFNEL